LSFETSLVYTLSIAFMHKKLSDENCNAPVSVKILSNFLVFNCSIIGGSIMMN
jgi:hypothetical protein